MEVAAKKMKPSPSEDDADATAAKKQEMMVDADEENVCNNEDKKKKMKSSDNGDDGVASAPKDQEMVAVDEENVRNNEDRKPAPKPQEQQERMKKDWNEELKNIDQMFMAQAQKGKNNLADVSFPIEQLKGITLYSYQEEAVRWMVHKETTNEPPPFWKKDARTQKWRCDVPCKFKIDQPRPVHGGILADDMGLGKTIQTLGLICANPPEPKTPKTTVIVCPVSVMSNWADHIAKYINVSKKGRGRGLKVEMFHGPNRNELLPKIETGKIDVLIVSYNTLVSEKKKLEKSSSDKDTDEEEEEEEKEEEATTEKEEEDKKKEDGSGGVAKEEQVDGKAVAGDLDMSFEKSDGASAGYGSVYSDEDLCSDDDTLSDMDDESWNSDESAYSDDLSYIGDDDDGSIFDFEYHRIVLDEGHIIRNSKKGFFQAVTLLKADRRWVLTGSPFVNRPDDIQALIEFLGIEPLNSKEVFKEKVTDAIMARRVVGLSRLRKITDHTILRRNKCVLDKSVKLPNKEIIVVATDFPDGKHSEIHDECYTSARAAAVHNYNCEEGDEKDTSVFTKLLRVRQACCDGKLLPDELLPADEKAELGRSPKTQALMDLISQMKTDEKAVIFSEWTSYLNLIGEELEKDGHEFTRLDGSMTPQDRQEAMRQFDIGSPRFMLCSLRAAGVGITLTRANVAVCLNPWWNFAEEAQAMDRVHRIGQQRDVRVYRLVMAGSIEERMVEYQEAKAALGKVTLDKLKKADLDKAKLTALKDLFEIQDNENAHWDLNLMGDGDDDDF